MERGPSFSDQCCLRISASFHTQTSRWDTEAKHLAQWRRKLHEKNARFWTFERPWRLAKAEELWIEWPCHITWGHVRFDNICKGRKSNKENKNEPEYFLSGADHHLHQSRASNPKVNGQGRRTQSFGNIPTHPRLLFWTHHTFLVGASKEDESMDLLGLENRRNTIWSP